MKTIINYGNQRRVGKRKKILYLIMNWNICIYFTVVKRENDIIYLNGNVKKRKILKLNGCRMRIKFGFKLQNIATIINSL